MSTETFSLFAGVAARDLGMAEATESRNHLVQKIREFLRTVARSRDNRCVTADDAYKFLEIRDGNLRELGNAAGSIFRSADWEFTGCWTPSTRVSNHARMLRVWRLKDGV
jgi:hypothetical protein